MKMIDFLCPKNGVSKAGLNKIIKLQIPEECCGIKTVLEPGLDAHGANRVDSCCDKHLYGWRKIWKNFYKPNDVQAIQTEISYGHACISCGEYNEYAIANQDDDKYKCYSCRIRL